MSVNNLVFVDAIDILAGHPAFKLIKTQQAEIIIGRAFFYFADDFVFDPRNYLGIVVTFGVEIALSRGDDFGKTAAVEHGLFYPAFGSLPVANPAPAFEFGNNFNGS